MSMEIPISTSLSATGALLPLGSICQTPSNSSSYLNQFRHRATKKRPWIAALQCTGTRRRRERGQLRVTPSNSSSVECSDSGGTVWDQPRVVEVIGIGSRVDSVLDYCLTASSSSPSVRFWDIIMTDSERGKLQQRHLGRDNNPNLIEAPLYPQSCHKAVILVASAGYDDDHTIAIDILGRIRAANGLVVAIILRLFDFEGLRRQDEVKILLHLYITIFLQTACYLTYLHITANATASIINDPSPTPSFPLLSYSLSSTAFSLIGCISGCLCLDIVYI